MKISVDDEEKEVSEGSTLREVVDDSLIENNQVIGVVRGIKEFKEKEKGKYQLRTSKGRLILDLNQSNRIKHWENNLEDIRKSKIRWASNDIVAIGPFSTEIEPVEKEQEYRKGDVFFGLSGLNNDNTYLMLAKREHVETYGVRNGKIGRIQEGKHLIDELGMGDSVKEIENVKKEKRRVDSFITQNYDLKLEDGLSIYTHIFVELNEKSPVATKTFFEGIKDGSLRVDRDTKTYVSTENTAQNIKEENTIRRDRYSVSVRNKGERIGNIYFYKKGRPSSKKHNIIGDIKKGKELVNNLKEGNKIKIRTDPPRILTVGMTQIKAQKLIESHDIEQERKKNKDDDAIVVKQDPQETMKVINKGKVKTIGVKEENIVEVKLFDEKAPDSVKYFRKITGLNGKNIGKLEVYFTSEEISNILFKGSRELAGNLSKENNPKEVSKPGEIGITNRSKSSNRGLIGIRLDESQQYGPTSESFKNTNTVGEVKEGLAKLNKLNDGDFLYLREVSK